MTHGSVPGALVVPSHPRWADKTGLPEAFLPESLLMFKDCDTGQPASARSSLLSSLGQSAAVATPQAAEEACRAHELGPRVSLNDLLSQQCCVADTGLGTLLH